MSRPDIQRKYQDAKRLREYKLKPLSELALKKNEYKDLLIDYPDAPTGRAYVGINKQPFMKSDTGIGFKGVVLQDENRGLVQCYECGGWYQILNRKHLISCTGGKIKTCREYRIKHGLFLTQSLSSDTWALQVTKNLFNTPNRQRGGRLNNHPPKNNQHTKTEAYKNLHGTCDLQILSRLVRFILTSHELPGRGNRGLPLYKVLVRRFGNYGAGLAAHGLPNMERKGTNILYTFPDGEELRININRWGSREILYKTMLEKCPVLTTTDLTKFLPKKYERPN